MKANIKFYLFYAAIFLIGASLSAGVFFAYGASVFPTDVFTVGAKFDFAKLVLVVAFLLKPLTLTFLSAFTIYACSVSAFSCLYIGTVFGRFTIAYCLSQHNYFTHGASLVILLSVGAVFLTISKEASLLRTSMKSVAPDPTVIVKLPSSSKFLNTYLSLCVCSILISSSAYMLSLYFRL